MAIPSALYWHYSITTCEAHNILAELCVLYLSLFNSGVSPTMEADGKTSYFTDSNAFLNYLAKNWGAHFREAYITDDAAIIPASLRICDPGSKSYLVWFKINRRSTYQSPTGNVTDLIIASYYGHLAVVKLLVKRGVDIEAKDGSGRTPLLLAAENGHEAIVKLLAKKGADIKAKDRDGQTPLLLAAENGHEAIVELLAEKGADIEAKNGYGQTPLSWAAEDGHGAIVELLVEKGADIEAKDKDGRTPLLLAAENGHGGIVELLVEKRAEIEAEDRDSWMPLL
ncbi:ankyrin repeat domain-containing protein [Trichoderma harzianum]|uniref:Ankyrin repeat domain-containing protein n=1 Tax=Trichoderma harzianum TaxID=5544 RepID=A0A0F9WWT3_TRIHA|nr:ankyrin repeat domain-containing protein [Trichoderma harzianum]